MIKLLSPSRSPATAAAGSAVLIVTALVGVILAAGIESGPATASGQAVSAPANAAPLVLPKPCVATRQRQTCGATGPRQRRAKQVKRQPGQSVGLPAPTVVPSATGP
jgi:hypothetical protein